MVQRQDCVRLRLGEELEVCVSALWAARGFCPLTPTGDMAIGKDATVGEGRGGLVKRADTGPSGTTGRMWFCDALWSSVPRRGYPSQPRVATQERTLGNVAPRSQP